MTYIYFFSSIFLVAGGLFALTYTIGSNEPEEAPQLGSRGLKRQRAVEAGGLFATIEGALRLGASWIAYLPLKERRKQLDVLLKHSGEFLGLTANELMAMCVLSGIGGGLLGGYIILSILEMAPALVLVAILLGLWLPISRVTNVRDERFKMCNRALPGSIDLASLCMGAGLDFPGSIRQIVDKAANKDDPMVEEWERVLQELDLGRTRRQALENLADRVPTEPIRDFVSAVVQSEQKGNPLSEVLRIQATMLRMRRSVMAEESAAKAAVKMLGPLVLILVVILMLIMGPFGLQFAGSGL